MPATFTNTEGVGWDWGETTVSQNDDMTIDNPSELADGILAVYFGAIDGISSNEYRCETETNTPVDDFAGTLVGAFGYWEQSGSADASEDYNQNPVVSEQLSGVIVAIDGYDSGNLPGADSDDFAVQSGTGTSINYPNTVNTASVNDLVFRWAAINGDVAPSAAPDTTIHNLTGDNSFSAGHQLSFKVGDGSTPGTDTGTLASSEGWTAYTVIVRGVVSATVINMTSETITVTPNNMSVVFTPTPLITDVNTTEEWDDGDTGLVITGKSFA